MSVDRASTPLLSTVTISVGDGAQFASVDVLYSTSLKRKDMYGTASANPSAANVCSE